LFYSDQDVVTITYDEDTFTITEYLLWAWTIKRVIIPEKQTIYLWKWVLQNRKTMPSNHRNSVEKCFITFTILILLF
jgi:hypothetical protein